MKTAEEWLDKWMKTHGMTFLETIEQAQKEAYNQAIDDAMEKAKLSLFDWRDGGFKEFKQNSNHYSVNDGNYTEIDKQSILKLKK